MKFLMGSQISDFSLKIFLGPKIRVEKWRPQRGRGGRQGLRPICKKKPLEYKIYWIGRNWPAQRWNFPQNGGRTAMQLAPV